MHCDKNVILRIEIGYDLWLLLSLYLLLALIIHIDPVSALRIILGLFCMLFVPGYTLLAALFPRNDHLSTSARITLSFGLSIPIVSLLGLVLNYTDLGIGLELTLAMVGLFILLCIGIAHYRRSRLSSEDRFSIRMQVDLSRWRVTKPLDKLLTVVVALSILAVVGALAYSISRPKAGEMFTEFYVLGPHAVAEGYAEEVSVGQSITVILAVVNREGGDTRYRVERRNGASTEQMASIWLSHGETWQQPYIFALTEPGGDQEVEFLLYKEGKTEPYRTLHLWISAR